jgi:hypothetical protein
VLERDVEILIARLMANRFVPREDALAQRALTDESFRHEVETRLRGCGLELLDNPYASHITVGLKRDMHHAVFATEENWLSNNLGLDRSAVALLVVLWALIILPKRQRQLERRAVEENAAQAEMFAEQKPLLRGEEVAFGVSERALLADFGEKLGKATRVNINLGLLSRLGFIVRKKGEICEGPLLDLVMDYNRLAGRIFDGALADMFAAPRTDPALLLTPEEADYV